MDTLRIILIVFGVILVAGIYLADRFQRRKKSHSPDWSDGDSADYESDDIPVLSMAEEVSPDEWVGRAVTLSAKRHEQLAEEQLEGLKGLGRKDEMEEVAQKDLAKSSPRAEGEETPFQPEDVIVLTVMTEGNKRFSGPLILKVLQEVGLQHGEMRLFHYFVSGKKIPLFSVANILEPGYFELSEIAAQETPGLALFMRLPTVIDGEKALDILLHKARQMAAQLSGTLCDEQRRPLEEDTLAGLQAKAQQFQTMA